MPIYCEPLCTRSCTTSLEHYTLLYSLPHERGSAAKLERIFIPSGDIPKHRSIHVSESSDRDQGFFSEQRLSFSLVSTTHSRWLFQTHPAPEIPQDDTFVPPPASQAAHPAYYEPLRVDYAQYYEPTAPVSLFTWRNLQSRVRMFLQSDRATHIYHHTPCAPQLNNPPAQPCGIATATAGAGPPFFVCTFCHLCSHDLSAGIGYSNRWHC
jgi:hypothetical protein